MRYVSAFSGVEAATLAWAPLGWEPLCLSEVDPFACAVLAERLPGVPNLGDITKVDWSVVEGVVDVLVGGSPCQSFSVAGPRTGLDGASGLMREYVRAVRELRPRWLVWENVPGALSSTHGEDFGCLLRELDGLGYGLAWRVLDAQFFGVAQRRRRLFLVGRIGDAGGPCDVLFEPEGLRGDPVPGREKRKELAARAGRGAEGAGGALNAGDPQSKRVFRPDGPAPTLSSGTGEGMNIQPSVLCGGPAAFVRGGAAYGIAGNVVGRMAGNGGNGQGFCGPDDCMYTLTSADRHAVAFAANQRGEVRLQGGDGAAVGAIQASQSSKQANAVSDGAVVRRLTPTECERLQGMPDGWTRVPYRGRPAEECPDGPRYRAIGNSMAVPVMRWIGVRLAAVDSGEDPGEAVAAMAESIFGEGMRRGR